MPAYIIVRVKVFDQEKYKEYLEVTPEIIQKFGGKAIVRGGKAETLEGPCETRRIVVLEFPSVQEAKEFYYSRDYQKARKIRENAAIGELLVVEGISFD